MISRTAKPNVELVQTQTALPVQQLAQAIQNNSGVVDIRNGKAVDMFPLPDSTTVTLVNPNTTDARAVTAYLFNEQVLKNTKTDNTYGGSATDADKPVVTYNDGFSGRLIDSLVQKAFNATGLRCKELTIIGKNASGVQDDAAIIALDAEIRAYNALRGRPVEMPYDLSDAIRNTQFKDGMVTVSVDFVINCVSQFVSSIPKGFSYTFIFKWDYTK